MRTGFSDCTTTPTPLALETGTNGTSSFALLARKGHEELRLLMCTYKSAPIHKPKN
jgi:hypothetical protein